MAEKITPIPKRLTPEEEKIVALAKSFPCLQRRKDLVSSFDANLLEAWAAGGASHGEKLVVQFLLTVWNYGKEWQCGKFNVVEAYRTWDDTHWQAFANWAYKEPFMC